MFSSGGSSRQSIIHCLDPRVRIAVAVVFAVLVVLFQRFAVLGIGLAISFLLLFAARAVTPVNIRRIAGLNVFLFFLAVLLPLSTPGHPFAQAGPLIWSEEGLLKAGLIALKANTVLAAFMALVGTMEHTHLGFALHSLGMPEKLTHILLFKVRYLGVIQREYHKLVDAMKLRAFRPRFDRHTFRAYGYLIGMLLVRSLDRAERIVAAMKCRGFRGKFHVMSRFRIELPDVVFVALCLAGMIALGWMEWI
jgi:cobalt/nickel transport system permease protein